MRIKLFRKIKIDWGAAILEVILVVLGILIAFSIDAWWDGVKEDGDRKVIMEGLLEELISNRTQLNKKISQHHDVVDAAKGLLAFTGPDLAPISEESSYEMIFGVLQSHTFNPEMGELNALLNSGNLKLIEKNSMAVKLASLPGHLADAAEEEDRGVSQVWETCVPYLNTKIPMLNLLEHTKSFQDLPRSKFPADFYSLFQDPYFENLLQNRMLISRKIIEDETALLQVYEELIEAFEKCLKKNKID